jgi:iron complex transport system substrate-binding protein
MLKRIIAIALVLILALGALAGCGKDKDSGGIPIGSDTDDSENQNEQKLTAPNGESIILPKTITSVVTVSPAAENIFDELGFSSKVKASYGVDENCTDAIISAKPDVVIYDIGASIDTDAIKAADIIAIELPLCKSMADVKKHISFIGNMMGIRTEEKVKSITDALNVMQLSTSTIKKVSVYFELGYDSETDKYMTIAPYSYIYEVLSSAGGESIFGVDSGYEGFISVSADEILAANPAVIFTLGSADDIKSREGWDSIAAVKNEQVYEIEDISPSFVAVDAAQSMHEVLSLILFGEDTENK